MMEELRSGAEQLKEELHVIYKRMTDPEERKKAAIIERRQQFTVEIASDAGVEYTEPYEFI